MDGENKPDLIGRRVLLSTAAAGVASVAVAGVFGPQVATAAVPLPVKLGDTNEAATATRFFNPDVDNTVSSVVLADATNGLSAEVDVDGGIALSGVANGSGVTGVAGATNGHSSSFGVVGVSEPEGIAVDGRTQNGTALRGTATGGYGLLVQGRAVFSRSGKLTFKAGQTALSVSNTNPAWYLSAATIVIATIQGNVPGTWVLGAYVNSTSKFTIRLNKAAPIQLVVGWFIVN